jgi:hypothetical protein
MVERAAAALWNNEGADERPWTEAGHLADEFRHEARIALLAAMTEEDSACDR